MSSGRIRIGTSGWGYRDWIGHFYPAGTRQRELLATYAGFFDAVEVNGTFYNLPAASTVDGWAAAVPEDFAFAVKAHQRITHRKKLKDPAASTPDFLAAARRLGSRLGPVLVQLPPNMKPNAERLDAFLAALPADLRVAVEFRDPAWFDDTVTAVLTRHGAARATVDAGGTSTPEAVTAPFAYARLHGPGATAYTGTYGDEALARWTDWLAAHRAAGRDAYIFFNNTADGAAPFDARSVRDRLAAG